MPEWGGKSVAAVVIASRNSHKVSELRQLLAGLDIEVYSLHEFPGAPEVVEDGDTFADNALKKARSVSQYAKLAVIADDSGLEVDYLQGQPGVRSARFAGESASDRENNEKLLELMQGVPARLRTACFRCTIALVSPTGLTEVVDGVCHGRILTEPKGTGGFGYDPLFLVPELGKTFAELSNEEKNAISHRGRALRATLPIMARWMQEGLL